MNVVRLVEHIHGQLGWLAALALVHPAVLLRRPRRALFATVAATSLATVTAALGALVYPHYRAQVKSLLFAQTPSIGWAFERKEHLGTGTVILAWAGLAAHLGVRTAKHDDHARRLARVAHRAYVAAAFGAVVTAALGVAVACTSSF